MSRELMINTDSMKRNNNLMLNKRVGVNNKSLIFSKGVDIKNNAELATGAIDLGKKIIDGYNQRSMMRLTMAMQAQTHQESMVKSKAASDYRDKKDLNEKEKEMITETFCRILLE